MKKMIVVLMLLSFVSVCFSAEFAIGVTVTDVSFQWDANPETDISGYNIYRSNVSGAYDSTKLVGTVNSPVVKFTDVGVEDGVWYWVITAFDTAGNEGGYSAELTATLDTVAPDPPKNFIII